ncbi:glycoside hydrolase family 78 protein [Annulohypoxylon maeteangense]|uniref:glycoside hydrolase family 78 protein n=1 Tax=Annulohypoxylon maeteangense TaxID=1927788 RepID=UPI00200744AA|nr:glycoside hydrolase family 78 protein [Annulohypoxylon maeteangense]KAI0883563.1 glycoside hydrolase family 78 protein [Annulohypoxylon maeteangense]
MGHFKLSAWLYGLTLCQLVLARCGQAQDNDTSWHQYVRAPTSSIVKPKAVLGAYTSGGVTNPDGLITGNNSTTLIRRESDTAIPTVVLDFGRNVVGLLEIDFARSINASNGLPGLKLYFSESLEFLGNRSDFTRSDNAGQGGSNPPKITSGTDQIAVKNKPFTWINQWGCEFGSQVCSDGLHGFRYVKIELDALAKDAPYTSPYGEIAINSVSLQWSAYLGTPDTYTGWFECSDAELTQWWYDGAYTTEIGTDVFRDNDTEPRGASSPSLLGKWVLLDGAKRDRDPYMGDLAVAALTGYLTHDFPEAARNVMEDLALRQRNDGWIPPASINNYQLQLFDYPLYWVTCSWDLVMYTGNLSYIEAYYPVLVKVLDTYYVSHTDNATSLLVRQNGYGDYAFIPRDGSATYYSALYVLALNRAADMASQLSKPGDASRWRDRAANVSAGVLANLWDASAGAFYDRKCTGRGCNAHAQDGNSIAILAGITASSPKYAESALSYLANATGKPYGHAFYDAGGNELGAGFSDRVSPFISYFETAARFESGLAESAVAQLRATYGHMAAADPGVTMWEGIGVNGSKYEGAFTSLAHGWSTGVTPLLTSYVLGVRPVKPGFREWTVRPLPSADLNWAKGVVPTPYGPLSVSWERNRTDGRIVVDVTPPPGTNGTVVVPEVQGGKERRAWADDGVKLKRERADGNVVFRAEGGRRYFVR